MWPDDQHYLKKLIASSSNQATAKTSNVCPDISDRRHSQQKTLRPSACTNSLFWRLYTQRASNANTP